MERRAGESVKSRDWPNGGSGLRVNDSTWREFSKPGRESGGLVLTLFTVNLAQDGGGGAGEGGRSVGRS